MSEVIAAGPLFATMGLAQASSNLTKFELIRICRLLMNLAGAEVRISVR